MSYHKHKKRVHQLDNNNEQQSSDEESSVEWINALNGKKNHNNVKCVMNIKNESVVFQIDTGSSVNILPQKYATKIRNTDTVLKTWNKNNYDPLGECRVILQNPRNSKKFNVNFIVCHDEFMPILGLKACEVMNLIAVKENNFERVHAINMKSNVFNDEKIGEIGSKLSLKLKENAQPIMMRDRKIPISLKEPLKKELQRLIELEVITQVEEPTEWVSQVVVVPKANGRIRVCLDPQELNKVLIRERYTLPTVNDVLHDLRQSKFFTKADCSSGYWQVKLDEPSSKLTTFQTCFGRYRWLRLPFGLSVSAEIFQKRLMEIFGDLKGVICVADDIIIHGKNEDEHEENVQNFLKRCENANVKLNKNKIEYKLSEITFMGHRITKDGLQVDREKVAAIEKFPKPENVSKLRSFLGLVNFVSQFIDHSADILQPLNNLLKKDVIWNWSEAQQRSFDAIKTAICNAAILSYYNPNEQLILENDASEYGLGSALIQNSRPIAYASRALSQRKKNYAQIEKELLAIVYGLEKFHHYIYGRDVIIYTDHRPLVSITQKPLSKAPKRLQSMLLRIQGYTYKLIYKKGTNIPVADALSRAPVESSKEVYTLSNAAYSSLTTERFDQIRMETDKDITLNALKEVIAHGWPESKSVLQNQDLNVYFSYRDELSLEDGIIYRGERFLIPKSLQAEMKEKIHAGHTGINSCLRRARTYLFWPGMSDEIRKYVENCNTCSSFQSKQSPEPLFMRKVPDHPWQNVGTDIFTINSRNYLITVDYYSQYFEVDYLSDTTSDTVIHKLKSNFARFGSPQKLISDNGPQFTSSNFKQFCTSWNITHETISPGNSKSNGAAEAAVKIAKNLMRKCSMSKEDPYIALLNLRNTPQENTEYTPVQRLMGRRTRTLLPTNTKLL